MLLDGTFDAVYKAPLVLGYVYNRSDGYDPLRTHANIRILSMALSINP